MSREVRSGHEFLTTHHTDAADHRQRVAPTHAGRLIACHAPSRLKARSIVGQLLDLRCQPLGMLSQERQHPQIDTAAFYGAAIYAVASEQLSLEVMSAYLSERGVRVERLAAIKPSLEAASVALLGAASPERPPDEQPPMDDT